MSIQTYLSFAVSPVLIIAGILYFRYALSLKITALIRNAVLLGMLTVILVILAQYLADLRWNGVLRNMRRMSFYVFVIIGFSAEFGKLVVLRLSFYKLKSFEGPIEGIIYASFIALGYTLVAVPLFAYGFIGTSKLHHMDLFLYTYPIANIVFAICVGFFIGMGKLRKNVLIDNATGLFLATFFHGLYYFSFITKDERLLMGIGVGYFLIAAILVSRAIRLRKMKD
jgi:RsiW-degrading membrane proteinase PrsW (M82 family)